MNPKHLKLLRTAQALDQAGRAKAAAQAYKAFLEHEPTHSDGWSDYAGQLMKLDLLEQAEAACETALRHHPEHLSAHINLGCLAIRQNRLEEAESQLRAVLLVDPRRMDAQLALAECLLKKEDLLKARKALEKASQPGAMAGRYAGLASRHADLWAHFAIAVLKLQRFKEAERACDTALRLDPQNLRAKACQGSLCMAQGQLEAAERIFRRLLAQDPSVRLLLIACLAKRGALEEADREIATVLREEPTDFTAHLCLVAVYYSLGRWADYRAEIQRFRTVDPSQAYLDFEQSFAELLFGDMPQGWEHYEARLRVPEELRHQRTFAEPAWSGEPFAGKTLLVWTEQGFGDTLMFARYLPQVKALGGTVLLETPPNLADLASTCAGVDAVIPGGSPFPPHDLQVSLLSLPWVFRTDLSTVPADIPYLDVPKEVPHRQELLERLAAGEDSTKIGLVWAGNPRHVRDADRSLPAAALAPLADLPGVTWYSFQLGRPEHPPLPNLIHLGPYLGNFSDTAYALSGMDLLITVDTSVAHLAGALGIPTLLLISYQPDWRWLLGRDDSPWYPSMRLYRQPAYGDWESVVRQVAADLAPQE